MTSSEEAREERYCPLAFNGRWDHHCEGHRCMWWRGDIESGTCAIADIADSLGDLGYIADALDGINKCYGYSEE